MATRKRANNEGSVYQRKNGRWIGAVSTPTGRKLYYGATRKAVQDQGALLAGHA